MIVTVGGLTVNYAEPDPVHRLCDRCASLEHATSLHVNAEDLTAHVQWHVDVRGSNPAAPVTITKQGAAYVATCTPCGWSKKVTGAAVAQSEARERGALHVRDLHPPAGPVEIPVIP